jgi:hypothetical protein
MSTHHWRKSSYSGDKVNCVEVAYNWRKSSYSGNKLDCVEVAPTELTVLVRDTKQAGTGPILTVTHTHWTTFLTALRTSP